MISPGPPASPQPVPRHAPRSRETAGIRLAVATVGLIAVAALLVGIVGLTRTPAEPGRASATAAEHAATTEQVCVAFEHAAQAIRVATNQPEGAEPVGASANARAALVGAALALTQSVSDNTPEDVATAANELADAYLRFALTAFAEMPASKTPAQLGTAKLSKICGRP